MSVSLRLFTDFVCPFCFIAEQSTVPRLLSEYDLTLDWRGFELHPGTPKGGLPLQRLFPGRDLAQMHAGTRRFAARFGVTDFSPPDRLQNSRRALAIAEWARATGRLEAFRAAVLNGHWRQGKDLESDADLAEMAVAAGLDGGEALAAADDPAWLSGVDAKQADARAHGVTGIPTFIIGTEQIVGCQPYEVLAAAAERARVPRRQRER